MLNNFLNKWDTSVTYRGRALLDDAERIGQKMFDLKRDAKNALYYGVLKGLHKSLCISLRMRLNLICAERDVIDFFTQMQRPQMG